MWTDWKGFKLLLSELQGFEIKGGGAQSLSSDRFEAGISEPTAKSQSRRNLY